MPTPRKRHPGSWSKWLGRATLVVWIPGLLLVLGSLMAGHWVTLPHPATTNQKLRDALAELRTVHGIHGWTAYHVLYDNCPCSRRVRDHLLTSERPAWLADVVIFVGEDPEFAMACRTRGCRFTNLDQAALHGTYAIEAAPLLVITRPDGELCYVGGYTDRRQGMVFRDLEIAERAHAGEHVEPIPVYGCGVSDSLQKVLDPLGLKY